MDGKSQEAMIPAPDADDVQYYGHQIELGSMEISQNWVAKLTGKHGLQGLLQIMEIVKPPM